MRIKIHDTSVVLWASARDTYDWAHKTGAAWPCSTLSNHRFCAVFDDNGLMDFTLDGNDFDVDSRELSAICADLVGQKLPKEHPCWFVVVGQFE